MLISHRLSTRLVSGSLIFVVAACSKSEPPPPPPVDTPSLAPTTQKAQEPAPPAAEQAPKRGLLLAYSQFDGTKPGAARVELLTPTSSGPWKVTALEDPESNVFHKALAYGSGEDAALITLGGMKAAVKLWKRTPTGFVPQTLWTESFGGKFDRMRDAELGDLYGTGRQDLAVGTHDQGVVAVLRNTGSGFEVEKLDRTENTFIHEIELGDLDKDGVLEVYATPSEPNRLDAGEQSGRVVRYVPKEKKGPTVVADLGKRHAKEILVDDLDGDGRDELYVAVEALTKGSRDAVEIVEPVEIRRYDYDTPADKGRIVARIDDRFCRFLTAGDVDGDGKKEMIAAAFRSGVWLLRPNADAKAEWSVSNIDKKSSGFEHAALLTDLDEDGRDELYVAADEQGELRRYVWKDGKVERSILLTRADPRAMWTWNIMPAPPELLK